MRTINLQFVYWPKPVSDIQKVHIVVVPYTSAMNLQVQVAITALLMLSQAEIRHVVRVWKVVQFRPWLACSRTHFFKRHSVTRGLAKLAALQYSQNCRTDQNLTSTIVLPCLSALSLYIITSVTSRSAKRHNLD